MLRPQIPKSGAQVAGWDWYATLSQLAGIDPTDWRADAAGLPPIDSLSFVPVLLGNGNSSRTELAVGTEPRLVTLYGHAEQVSTLQGVIQQDSGGQLWKLLLGEVEQSGWTGPAYPNRTSNTCCFNSVLQNGNAGRVPKGGCPAHDPCPNPGTARAGVSNCTSGCLYELRADPSERVDLAASHPGVVARLTRRLEQLRQSAFLPVRCQCEDGFGGISCVAGACEDKAACARVLDRYGGFWGPWIDI